MEIELEIKVEYLQNCEHAARMKRDIPDGFYEVFL